MKVCVIGGYGSIGTRYRAILAHLGVASVVYDTVYPECGSVLDLSYDRAIVATPTSTHAEYAATMLEHRIPVLIEKPLSKSVGAIYELIKKQRETDSSAYVVNNYAFLLNEPGIRRVSYSYFKTGGDGLWWDVCQLIYLSTKHGYQLQIGNTSPTWDLWVDGKFVEYRKLEESYIEMMQAWLYPEQEDNWVKLWTLHDGLNMTVCVQDRMEKNESTDWNTGT